MAIIERDSKYLVLNLSYRNGFNFPGGLVEPFESLEEALKREVREETGLVVQNFRYFTSQKDKQYGFPVLVTAFIVEADGTIKSSSEGEVSWRSAEEIINFAAYKNAKEAFVAYVNQK